MNSMFIRGLEDYTSRLYTKDPMKPLNPPTTPAKGLCLGGNTYTMKNPKP